PLASGLGRRGLGARQIYEHRDGERREEDRNELRRREHADSAAFVAAVELDDETGERVEEHVEPERPPWVRLTLTLGGQEHDEDQKLRPCFIELRGMKRDVERGADVRRRKRVGECDAPRFGRRASVTAPRKEASKAPDHVAKG